MAQTDPPDPGAQWDTLEAALDQILELPEGERVAACARLAADDPALRREIESLLPFVDGDDPVLDHPLESRARVIPDDVLKPDTRVGAYRIAALVGHGGMGDVYRAERADGLFEQQVALKVMQAAAAAHAGRFHLERQVLARLEHPGIARLIDGGVLPDGRPYTVMELIDGDPLMTWCRSRLAPMAERLRLFGEICAAVAYVHRNGVAHLDVKPQNVLVTHSGAARLLDFGVARLLEGAAAHTLMRDSPVTPGYAAPEQLTRGKVSMASDVFGLGLLLYELLCGELPPLAARSIGEAAPDTGVQWSLQPPSRFAASLANPPVAPRLIERDLDAIVGKALQHDPKERYDSAREMLEDFDAWREGRAVSARPSTLAYRIRKSFGRHRREVLGACVTLGAAALAAFVFWWHGPGANPAGVVDAPDPKSIAVLPFLDLSEHRDREYFSDGLSEELIDLLARNPFLRVVGRTSSFHFKGKSEDVAAIARALHVANILEGSVRESDSTLRVTSRLVRADDGYPLWSHSYDRRLTDALKVQEEIAAAVAIALQAKLVDGDPTEREPETVDPEAFRQYLLARYLMTSQLQNGGAAAAVEALEKSVEREPDFVPALAALAFARCMDAVQKGQRDVMGGSRALLERAVSLAPDLPAVYAARSNCRRVSLDFAGALQDGQRAYATGRNDVRFQNSLSYALASNGRLPEAVNIAREAASLDPLNLFAWQSLGEFLAAIHDWPAAEAALRRAVAVNPRAPGALFDLAVVLMLQHRLDQASSTFAANPSARLRLRGVALVEHSLGHLERARAALTEMSSSYGDNVPCYAIAQVHAWQGDRDAAVEWLQKAAASGDAELENLAYDPLFDDVRADSRYRALVRKLGSVLPPDDP